MTTGATPVVVSGSTPDTAALVAQIAEEDGFSTAVAHVLTQYEDNLAKMMAEQFVMTCQLYDVLMRVKPVIDNPNILLESMPPAVRAMLGI